MLKAKAGEYVFFGLTETNLLGLREGKPIRVILSELGLPGAVVIFYRETEDGMLEDLDRFVRALVVSPPPSLISEPLRRDLVEMARAAPAGDIVEVGVYRGGSAYQLAEVAREQGRRLYLFDTFTGIPTQGEHDRHPVGDFGDTSLEAVREAIPDAVFVVGVFPDTLEGLELGPIAFAHIDCDQYESVKACCVRLAPLMAPGGVMVFDDYDMLEGATLAVDEVFGERVERRVGHKAKVTF